MSNLDNTESNSNRKHRPPVPTNIITGFLGTGKTSAILHLLASKPSNENWAILVNEFGEVGVDGSLFWGSHAEESGVYIREVTGGCMCCASGVPVQIALSQLLSRAKPDRLLIEPTGLGHPVEIVELLSADHYKKALSLQHIITLVDARKLSDSRYTGHDTFKQQLMIADVVVGNKQDLYNASDKAALNAYMHKLKSKTPPIHFTQNGQISIELLIGDTCAIAHKHDHSHPDTNNTNQSTTEFSVAPLPECGYLSISNEGEGFQSIGWRFASRLVFDYERITRLLSEMNAERIKAVVITDKGIFSYNLTADGLSQNTLDECMESRIEVIDRDLAHADLQNQLLACVKQ